MYAPSKYQFNSKSYLRDLRLQTAPSTNKVIRQRRRTNGKKRKKTKCAHTYSRTIPNSRAIGGRVMWHVRSLRVKPRLFMYKICKLGTKTVGVSSSHATEAFKA